MKYERGDLEIQAEQAIKRALEGVPLAHVGNYRGQLVREGSDRSDIELSVRVAGGAHTIIAEVSASGEPRYARTAVLKLSRMKERHPGAYPVFVAPYISPKSAHICDEEGVGYVDFAGNCKLAFGGVFIERVGKPNPHATRRPLRSLYSPKAERVLRELLNRPRRAWKDRDLAREAHVSIGHVSNVKRQLTSQEWIRQESVGWTMVEPEEVLRAWAENYDPARNRRHLFYSPALAGEAEAQLSAELEALQVSHAFTAFSAAARWAAAVRYNQIAVYVASVDGLSLQSVRPVTSGANVQLIVPRDDGVLLDGRVRHDLRVVSPIQTYLDLLHAGGRKEEAAETMLDYVRKFCWQVIDE